MEGFLGARHGHRCMFETSPITHSQSFGTQEAPMGAYRMATNPAQRLGGGVIREVFLEEVVLEPGLVG